MAFNIDKYLESALKRKEFPEPEFIQLCDAAIEILIDESTVPARSTPITVCGDIHGQFYDLLRLFEIGGNLPDTRYIFLGDYVDRGRYSLETLTLLLCFLVKYPDHITLLRGNHESRQISHNYGFFDECMRRYGNTLPWTKCMEVFDCLPVACLVDEKYLCVHGGLSPEIRTIDQIRLIDRRMEVPTCGAFSDLMWSDPDSTLLTWAPSQRGAGYTFGKQVTREFAERNGLKLIARAHQLVAEGFKYAFDPDQILVTVWSAPNYSYRCGNIAAVMQLFPDESRHFVMFSEVGEVERETPPRMPVPYFM